MRQGRRRIIADVLKKPYARIFRVEEEGGYSTEVLEFRGCFSSGDSVEEAMANLEDAMRVWVQSQIDQERTIPEPLAQREYSGRMTFRLPPATHEMAAEMAAAAGVSLNRWLSDAVAKAAGAGSIGKFAAPAERSEGPALGGYEQSGERLEQVGEAEPGDYSGRQRRARKRRSRPN